MGDHVKADGLRATCVTFLFEARHRIKVIARKTGHLDPRSALLYHNTQVCLVQQLQPDTIAENVTHIPIEIDCKLRIDQINMENKPCKAVEFNDSNCQTNSGSIAQANDSSTTNRPCNYVLYPHRLGSNDANKTASGKMQPPSLGRGCLCSKVLATFTH